MEAEEVIPKLIVTIYHLEIIVKKKFFYGKDVETLVLHPAD